MSCVGCVHIVANPLMVLHIDKYEVPVDLFMRKDVESRYAFIRTYVPAREWWLGVHPNVQCSLSYSNFKASNMEIMYMAYVKVCLPLNHVSVSVPPYALPANVELTPFPMIRCLDTQEFCRMADYLFMFVRAHVDRFPSRQHFNAYIAPLPASLRSVLEQDPVIDLLYTELPPTIPQFRRTCLKTNFHIDAIHMHAVIEAVNGHTVRGEPFEFTVALWVGWDSVVDYIRTIDCTYDMGAYRATAFTAWNLYIADRTVCERTLPFCSHP